MTMTTHGETSLVTGHEREGVRRLHDMVEMLWEVGGSHSLPEMVNSVTRESGGTVHDAGKKN
jgi:hypothetical protein